MKKICRKSNGVKMLLLAFIVAGLALIIPYSVSNAATLGDYEYEIVGGEVTITDYFGTTQRLTIPRSLNGWPVTKIGALAFSGSNNIKELYIPNTVTTIEVHAFARSGIQFVSFSNTLVSIGDYAFYHCYNLTSLNFPASVARVGNFSFDGCNLSKLFFDGMTPPTFGNGAFAGSAIHNVMVPRLAQNRYVSALSGQLNINPNNIIGY